MADGGGRAAGCALLGGTMMGITALGLVGGRRLAGGDPRRAFAVLTAAFGVGQIVGPTVAGLLHDWTGSFVLPSLLAAGALVARLPRRSECACQRHPRRDVQIVRDWVLKFNREECARPSTVRLPSAQPQLDFGRSGRVAGGIYQDVDSGFGYFDEVLNERGRVETLARP